MKYFLMLFGLLFFHTSFCQPVRDTSIYERIALQLCNCFKESIETDSIKRKTHCYEFVLKANYEELKTYGVDTAKNKDFKKYYDLYLKRFRKSTEVADDTHAAGNHSKDDSFMGSLVKQRKLSNGNYNIVLRSAELRTDREFTSPVPVNETELKRFVAGEDNIIVAYQTVYRDGKKEFKIKSILYLGTEKE